MSHDAAWGSALILAAVTLFVVLVVAGAAQTRRREEAEDQAAIDAWHEQQAIRLANDTPIHDGVVIDAMETELVIESATRYVDAEWWLEDGGGAA